MSCLTESSIVEFLLRPEELPTSERARIEDHLTECNSCRSIRDYLEEFYEEIEEVEESAPDDLDALIDALLE